MGVAPDGGNYGGSIETLTCAREYSNCQFEAFKQESMNYEQYMARNCRQYSQCSNDATNYIARYMDYAWSTVGANQQPSTTVLPVQAESALSSSTSTLILVESTTVSTSSATTTLNSSARSTIASDTVNSGFAAITSQSLISSTMATMQDQANTTRSSGPSTTHTTMATLAPTQISGASMLKTSLFKGTGGIIALLAIIL